MSAEVAEDIRQTRRVLTEKTWVPWPPSESLGEVCAVTAVPGDYMEESTWGTWEAFAEIIDWLPEESSIFPDDVIAEWNDRQTDVGAVLGMTLEALIAELCKGVAA